VGTRQRGELPKDLAQARCRFEAWRERRLRGRRIPQPLWDLAVQLAGQHGVSRTATALGLNDRVGFIARDSLQSLRDRAQASAGR
jgi:hypothetical protein